ncbi:MAG: carbon-nitrogen family hydrolase [Acidobacteria bacterium]|nr:carbon-nitrogen family hydrolase [Acidobacteriota bacterium]
MKVCALQFDIVWENKRPNHDKVRWMLDHARPEKGSLVVLPEMFATGFSMNVAAIHDSDTLETHEFMSHLAADYRVYLNGGVVVRDISGRGRNDSVLFDPRGNEIARYSKIQPFSIAGETNHYVAGNDVVVTDCGEFKLEPFICYDLRFPELFRSAAARGANLFTVIANWPVARVDHWITLLRARAIENQAFVVGVNRCGNDPELKYPGRSMIIDPRGVVLEDAADLENYIFSTLDLDQLLEYRNNFPILSDIRPDFVPRH